VSVIEGHGYDGIDPVPAPIQRLAEANETDAGRLQSLCTTKTADIFESKLAGD
jgi:hypothetical protein